MDSEILNFEDSLSVSFYHFVCDANVRDDKGNVRNETLKWIIELLQNQGKRNRKAIKRLHQLPPNSKRCR